jgi:choline dehydrogenase
VEAVDRGYDVVVVGAGAAGSVLARRLAARPGISILILEAGDGAPPPAVAAVPHRWAELHFTALDWALFSVEQPALDGRRVYLAAGRGPGGSSNLYHMIHLRGPAADYDGWAAAGAAGWSWADVRPYFDRLEEASGGPMPLLDAGAHGGHPLSAAFIEACEAAGHPRRADLTAWPDGVGWLRLNIADGRRHGARQAYLEPALALPDVTLLTGAQATRVLIEGGRAVGVEYVRDGAVSTVRADAEVILCAGAIQSPKLLLLSGIGPADELRALGIAPRVHLPGVGANFHDHALLVAPVLRAARDTGPEPRLNLAEAALFASSSPGVPPDVQIGFVHRAQFQPEPDPRLVTALAGLVRPRSRGTVRLAGPDPLAAPLIDPAYLADPADAERLVTAFELARELMHAAAFAPWELTEVTPGPEIRTRTEVLGYARAHAGSYFHYAGSARMGADEDTVTDPRLRVHGVDGLRVADASVMPALPAVNCHATVLMIAERAADLITAERHAATAAAARSAP